MKNVAIVKRQVLMILLLLVSIGASALFISSPVFAGANVLSDCGGDGQRACCAGTFEVLLGNACDSGNTEVPGCSGSCLCGGVNPFEINASGTCKARESCGGENERACCDGLSEGLACGGGLIKIEGCAGNCLCGGIGTGQVSEHTCAKPVGCGGEGQRACCAVPLEPRRTELNGACEAGLVESPGCTGDCSCGDELLTVGKSSSTCVAENWASDDIAEPGTQWTAPAQPRDCPLKGYADIHLHLNAHLAHGGGAFAGLPAPLGDDGLFTLKEGGINTALSAEDDEAMHDGHGLFGDAVGDGTKDGSTGNSGAPAFNNWPTWTTTTHQQTYYPWLERAYRGGLRLTVMLAVTNEAMCKGTNKDQDTEWPLCEDSMGPILDQLEAAWDFQRFIDDQNDGPGTGWFRIVTEPTEAREIIAEGKLAVVLGIEVDNLFNCKETGCAEDFGLPADRINTINEAAGGVELLDEPTTLEDAVQVIYDLGVRHVFPVHNFDNAFGAAATWQDVIGVGQFVSEGRWWELEDCGNDKGDYGFWIDNALQNIVNIVGFAGLSFDSPPFSLQLPPEYINGNLNPGYASCNQRGLRKTLVTDDPTSDYGKRLLDALMDHGMLIDVDHMSNHSLDDTIELTKQEPGSPGTPYPLLASHVQFFDLHDKEYGDNGGRHERMRTKEQLAAIKNSGGMIAAMLKDDVQDTGNKGKKFTQAYTPLLGPAINDDCRHSSSTYAQAYQYAVDTMGAPVAFGSDFNGIAGHTGPRFGSGACGGDIPFSVEVGSTNERSAQMRGDNRLQYPFTLPGFGEFNEQVSGVKTFDFNVDGLAHVGLLPDMVKDMETIGLSKTYIDALFNSAEEYVRVWERAKAISNNTGIPVPPDALSCPPLALCIGADDEAPVVTCPADIVKECTGPETVVTFDPVTATADNCGAAISQGCGPASGSAFEVGSMAITCSAIDNSRNIGSCRFQATVQDTTKPEITAPLNVTAECASPKGTIVTLGVPETTDICDLSPIVANNAPALFPLGSTSVNWSSTDSEWNVGAATQTVTIEDTIIPDLTVSVTPTVLWPPNQKLVKVRVDISASDVCDAIPAIKLVSITSNESDNGKGDGNTENDIQGAVFGMDDREFQLRAERSGGGGSRIYSITYEATDASGNTALKQVTVSVPKSQKGNK
ncbi:MAG: microsomal dipeptidase-like Zn-dependent dipeptidase [Paraglaciecola sp.]|jgi:microsomal dipeptidase-like Zn-dependent dipeptidase